MLIMLLKSDNPLAVVLEETSLFLFHRIPFWPYLMSQYMQLAKLIQLNWPGSKVAANG